MNEKGPMILSPSHITKAMSDSNFFTMMPEFSAVKKKIEAMHTNLGTGCTPCRRRRIATSLSSDFLSVLDGLSDESMKRMKKYFGVSRMLVRASDKRTGRVVMKEV